MPNELLVRVARTDYVDASLRGCSEHEFPWRARAQPKLRSEFIPSTSAPATETQPSRNSTSPNSCSSLSEKCPTTDQWASHGKLTNHGAQQGEIVRRDKSIALKDDSQRYQDKTGLLQPVVFKLGMNVSTWSCETGDESASNGIANLRHHNGNRGSCFLGGTAAGAPAVIMMSTLARPPAREGDRLFPHDVATGSLSVRLIGNQRFPAIKLSHQNFSDRCPRIVRLFYSS